MLQKNTKTLNHDIVILCKHFAELCYQTNIKEYYKRNQKDIEKIKKDISFGKMAEFGVYYILLEKGIDDLTIPDLSVYNYKNKSFDADLKCKNFYFHIKSQTTESASKYGSSWTFQKKDPFVLSPKENDYFIGTQIDENKFEVKILLSKKANELKFGSPKLDKLVSKTCIYLEDNL